MSFVTNKNLGLLIASVILSHVFGCQRNDVPSASSETNVVASQSNGKAGAEKRARKSDGHVAADGAHDAKDRSNAAAKADGQHGKGERKRAKNSAPPITAKLTFVSAVRLLDSASLRQDLSLSAAQSSDIAKVQEKRAAALQAISDAGEGQSRKQLVANLPRVRQELSNQAAGILNETQRNRLAGTSIQVNGINSLADPFVAAMLKLTEEQNVQLEKIRKESIRSNQNAKSQMRVQSDSLKKLRTTSDDLMAEEDKKILSLLTEEQQHQLASIKRPRNLNALTTPAMVAKLHITDAQVTALTKIRLDRRAEVNHARENGKDPSNGESKTKIEALRENGQARILEVLTSEQRQLLKSLPGEPVRPRSITSQAIAKSLNLSDTQNAQIKDIRDKNAQELKRLDGEIRKLEGLTEAMQGKATDRTTGIEQRSLALLTVEQTGTYASLKGKGVHVDLLQLKADAESTE